MSELGELQRGEFDRRVAHLRAEVAHAEDELDMLDGDMEDIKELLGLNSLKRLLARPPLR